jgi:hypothetical protein
VLERVAAGAVAPDIRKPADFAAGHLGCDQRRAAGPLRGVGQRRPRPGSGAGAGGRPRDNAGEPGSPRPDWLRPDGRVPQCPGAALARPPGAGRGPVRVSLSSSWRSCWARSRT